MSKLLDEALLDAKQVREVAEKNAMRILVEKSMPRIREFISARLEDDAFDEEHKELLHDDEEEMQDTPENDVYGPTSDTEDEVPLTTEPEEVGGDVNHGDNDIDNLDSNDADVDVSCPMQSSGEEQVFNIDIDFDEDEMEDEMNNIGGDTIMASELYKLLEADQQDESTDVDKSTGADELDERVDDEELELDEKYDEVPGEEDPSLAESDEVDEWVEISEEELEAALAEMDNIDEGPNQPFDNKAKVNLDGDVLALKESVRTYRNQLNEMKVVVNKLRSQIHETNLFNAKLLYATKLVNRKDITNENKERVIDTLDKATSIREVKLVYETFVKALVGKGSVQRQVNESAVRAAGVSGASRPTKPAGTQLNENADFGRWRTLAGLNS
tara:strand:+ start:353 stop:1510 length:1158 start_codon:yes stop_codon:yes gene_type:complete